MHLLRLLAAAVLATAAPALAQGVPALDVPAKELADARKYFLFHQPGVTPAQAEADLVACWRFLPHGRQRAVPGFVPWNQPDAPKAIPYSLDQFGLTGAVIGAIIAGPLERSLRQSRLFRCMVPRGYARYRTSEAIWKQLNEAEPAEAIRLQAAIAAGPVPPTPRIVP